MAPHKNTKTKSSGSSTPRKTSVSSTTEKTVKKEYVPSEAAIFSMDGKKVGSIALPEAIFGTPWRADLVHQVTTAMQANLRQNRAHTKDRSEVSGGGKKPWKQKGTGQARHSSTRSPIWRHGGITFGPRNTRDYSEKINKKMRAQALLSILSRKAKDGEIILIDKLSFAAPKTAEAKKFISALASAVGGSASGGKGCDLATKKKNAALLALASYNANAIKSFGNFSNVMTEELRSLNPLAVATYKYLVIENPEAAFKALAARSKSSAKGGPASGGK